MAGLEADGPSVVSFWMLESGEDEDESLYAFGLFDREANAEAFEANGHLRVGDGYSEGIKFYPQEIPKIKA